MKTYRVSLWKVILGVFFFLIGFANPIIARFSWKLMFVFLKIIWLVLPLGSGPDDILFLMIFVPIILIALLHQSTRVAVRNAFRFTIRTCFLEENKGKRKRKAKRDIPVPNNTLAEGDAAPIAAWAQEADAIYLEDES